eukprot:TRINITY_DN6465_c0_g1_i1.p1 TRINITY_DN6465_c0_g1~~TRINITY_DN6465_c0_g1_i1.p1  ORF type:complete len:135 (+),score=40.46 TRINITY_DN6465_c0_g1_i1:564-968(+)
MRIKVLVPLEGDRLRTIFVDVELTIAVTSVAELKEKYYAVVASRGSSTMSEGGAVMHEYCFHDALETGDGVDSLAANRSSGKQPHLYYKGRKLDESQDRCMLTEIGVPMDATELELHLGRPDARRRLPLKCTLQ